MKQSKQTACQPQMDDTGVVYTVGWIIVFHADCMMSSCASRHQLAWPIPQRLCYDFLWTDKTRPHVSQTNIMCTLINWNYEHIFVICCTLTQRPKKASRLYTRPHSVCKAKIATRMQNESIFPNKVEGDLTLTISLRD